jgi:hypothetical protein
MIQADNIKPFILHEEGIIREFAVRYFAEGNMDDVYKVTIMPLVLQSCERYAEQERHNRLILSYAKQLPQTPETIAEIIERLKTKKEINFWYESIIRRVAIEVIAPFQEAIFSVVSSQTREVIKQRLQMASRDTQSLWEELLAFGDEAAGKYINEFAYSYGEYIAEELSRREDLSAEQILKQFQSYDDDVYFGYSKAYIGIILGKRRMKEAVSPLLECLASEVDLHNEIAQTALGTIGDKEVVEIIKKRFMQENFTFQLFASGVLARIKCKESEQAILELLAQKKCDITVTTALANSLCELLSVEGIPIVKQYIDNDEYDRGMLSLEESLYATCVLANVDLPELAQWKMEIEAEQQRMEKFQDKFLISSKGMNLKLPIFSGNRPVTNEKKIGRNDPCPCQSGKKYKKCCGK